MTNWHALLELCTELALRTKVVELAPRIVRSSTARDEIHAFPRTSSQNDY